ncbi:MAG TPA: D-aminoacylase [Thermodesulfobacteriota bacterium]
MTFDLVIEGGTVVDGTGAPARRADVGLAGDMVAALGDLAGAPRRETLPAAGLVVAPGFVDAHSHSDVSCLLNPQGTSSLLQGITTEVVGNCGYSLAPFSAPARAALFDRFLDRCLGLGSGDRVDWDYRTFGEFMAAIERRGTGTNKAFLVGQGTLRACVMGSRQGPAAPDERAAMRRLLVEALEAGAVGLSTGREYRPGCYADTDEVIDLARTLGDYGGLYVSHVRNESDEVEAAVHELIEIGRRSGQPVQLSHHNVVGRRNRGRLRSTIAAIERARDEGLDVAIDFLHFHPFYHPHRLDELFPPEVSGLPFDRMQRAVRAAGFRERMHAAFRDGWVSHLELTYPGADWDYNVLDAPGLDLPEHASIAEMAGAKGAHPLDLAIDLVLAARGPIIVSRVIAQEDVDRVLRHPLTMMGTDTYAIDGRLDRAMALHPRNHGAFPRFLARYVRERGVMSLPEAIRRLTGYPAERFRLSGRGRLAPGYAADVVVFDPDRIADRATLADPYGAPEGIARVFVNGVEVVRDGAARAARPGRIVRRA